ncbi:MAG: hypothetical protein ABEJ93_04840 [Candidatus Nanohalobium sp.]
MSKRFHGTDCESILEIADEGVIEPSEISAEEIFPKLSTQQKVYNTEEVVWVTDSEDCARSYAWGGGYFVIDTSSKKVVSDRGSSYGVIPGEVPLADVEAIMLEENALGDRDFLLELADKLSENGFGGITLQEYQGPTYEIKA